MSEIPWGPLDNSVLKNSVLKTKNPLKDWPKWPEINTLSDWKEKQDIPTDEETREYLLTVATAEKKDVDNKSWTELEKDMNDILYS